MSSTFKRETWTYRLIALGSLLGAAFALYLAGREVAIKVLTHKIERHLDQAQVYSGWARLSWKGRGLCAEHIKLESRTRAWASEADELCVKLTLTSEWPIISAEDIWVRRPTLWVHDHPFAQASDATAQEVRQSEPQLLKRSLSQIDRKLSTLTQQWQMVWSKLGRLGSHQVEIEDLTLHLSRQKGPSLTLISRGDLTLHSRRGVLTLPPVKIGALRLLSEAKVTLNSESVALTHPLEVSLTRMNPHGSPISANLLRFTIKPQSQIIISPELNFKLNIQTFMTSAQNQRRSRSVSPEFHLSAARADTYTHSASKTLDQLKPWQISLAMHLTSSATQSTPAPIVMRTALSLTEVSPLLNVTFTRLSLADLSQLAQLIIPDASPVRDELDLDSQGEIKALISGELSAPILLTRSSEQLIQSIRGQILLERVSAKLASLPTMSLPTLRVSGIWSRSTQISQRDAAHTFDSQSVRPQLWQWTQAKIDLAPYSSQPVSLIGGAKLVLSGASLKPSMSPLSKRAQSLIPQKVNRFQLALDLEPVKCQRLYDLIPQTLLGPIIEATIEGTLSSKLRFTYQAPRGEGDTGDPVEISLKGLRRRCRFAQLKLNLPHLRVTREGRRIRAQDVRWLKEPFTYTIDPKWTKGEEIRVGPEHKNFVSIAKLPSYVGGAMYLTEETGFWGGGALSMPLITRAINTNLKKGSFVYGGSTITQQLVKNLFLHREKTLTRKFREVMISAGIIDNISKKRVLELYLNVIEFGPKIFGIQAASRYYFQKSARDLTPEEAIFLAMLKVSPHRGPKWIRRGSSPTFTWWRNRSVQVFERLVSEGLLPAQRARGAAPFVLEWSKGRYVGSRPLNSSQQ